jgi:alpha-tubulin suppressor-like RCC1 family protein
MTNCTAVAANGYHTCAALNGGAVKCWGSNDFGEIGVSTAYSEALSPVAVSGVTNASSVASGEHHSCALMSSGAIQCWGNNVNGELGNGSTTDSATPVLVSGITNAAAFASGSAHTCALLNGGAVQCWGLNSTGQLGNGTTTNSSTPVPVSGITNAIAIGAGNHHSCAVLNGGSVSCWGGNNVDQLGNGTTTDSSTPVLVVGISNASAVAGGEEHTCALQSNGVVQCWGDNSYSQLGNISLLLANSTAVPVPGINNATAIACGTFHSCALLSGGAIQCWGYNSAGQVGTSNTTGTFAPATVSGF